jgi:hypothetical protein
MKNTLLLFAIILFFIGCNSGTDETKPSEETINHESVDSSTTEGTEEPVLSVTNKPSLWTVEYEDNSKTEKLKKPEEIKFGSISATDLINTLNETYTDVQLKYEKISHDTIFVKIPESEKLTQQMGSTGAYNYMAATVFNLTELNHIKYVKFDFQGGDHASPGVFTREDFKLLR